MSVYAWKLSTGKVTNVLTVNNGPVGGLYFHPDESLPKWADTPTLSYLLASPLLLCRHGEVMAHESLSEGGRVNSDDGYNGGG